MRILVTGHAGYVGTVLTDMLRWAGHEPVGADAFFFDGCGLPNVPPGVPAEVQRRDLRDLGLADLEGVEAVVHLAALSNDPLGSLSPSLTETINHRGSIRLARLAKAAGVPRYVFASSCSLYGAAGPAEIAEDAPLRPLTAYGFSKVEVERELTELADDTFSPTSLRAATAYGVSPMLRADVVVNNLVGSALTRGEVRLQSDGRSWRPLLHVEDLCRAFLAVLEAPREDVHGEAFNVVPEGENYQIRDVAEMVADAIPGVKVTVAEEGGAPDPRSYRVDGSKLLSRVPAFKPIWTVAEGIRQLRTALADAGLSEEEFFGPRFVRLAHLKKLLAERRLDGELRWTPPSNPRPAGTEVRALSYLEAPPPVA